MEELAASFGWSYALFNSNAELRNLLRKTVDEGWTEPRFVAKLRDTKWYKRHGEAARQALVLQKTDPKEFARRSQQMSRHIQTLYGQQSGGQKLTSKWLKSATSQAMMLGWTDEELKYHIAKTTGYKSLMSQGKLGGQAGQVQDAIEKLTSDYGIKVSNDWKAGRIKAVMMGTDTVESIQNYMQKYAKSQYRAYANEIDQGLTIKDIAEPYVQSMAKVLELNPGAINIFDNKIQAALTRHDPESGKPTTKPIWEFENELRSDPRWNKTQNAQESLMSVGHSLLSQFGLVT